MTILEELQEMVERLGVIGLRIEHEPELVMLDNSPTYKAAADAIQSAGIELNRRVTRRHCALTGQVYDGRTVGQAIVERMVAGRVSSNVPCIQSWPTAEMLAEMDNTP